MGRPKTARNEQYPSKERNQIVVAVSHEAFEEAASSLGRAM